MQVGCHAPAMLFTSASASPRFLPRRLKLATLVRTALLLLSASAASAQQSGAPALNPLEVAQEGIRRQEERTREQQQQLQRQEQGQVQRQQLSRKREFLLSWQK